MGVFKHFRVNVVSKVMFIEQLAEVENPFQIHLAAGATAILIGYELGVIVAFTGPGTVTIVFVSDCVSTTVVVVALSAITITIWTQIHTG